jgi:hypothetical protein
MRLSHCLIALMVIATACVQPADAGGILSDRMLRRLEAGLHAAAAGMQGEGAKSKPSLQGKQPNRPPADKPPQTPPVKKETTTQWLLRFLGISAAPSAMKGEDDTITGDLWLHDTESGTARRITREGGYRSPIVLTGETALLALRGEQVIEIAIESGQTEARGSIPGVVKLIGVAAADPNQVLFLRQDASGAFVAGALSLKDGRREERRLDLAAVDEQRMLAHLRGWQRSYDGGQTSLYTKIETKEGLAGTVEWRDVWLKRAGRDTTNISHCDGVNCGQPSLSPNGRWVVYVKAM